MTGARVLAAAPIGLLMVASVIALPLGGCTISTNSASSAAVHASGPDKRGDVGSLTYRAVDRLVAALPELTQGKSVVVGSIVDVQDVDKSAPLGNLVADFARSRLVQKGVMVSEMRLRSAVMFDQKQGVITLANDHSAVMAPPSASVILNGTYAASDDKIFVSLRMVGVADARIVGAVDFEFPRLGSENLLEPPTPPT